MLMPRNELLLICYLFINLEAYIPGTRFLVLGENAARLNIDLMDDQYNGLAENGVDEVTNT